MAGNENPLKNEDLKASEESSVVSAGYFQMKITHKDGHSRAGLYGTHHGVIETPAFMPVGTQATVKTLTPRQLEEIQPEVILANTYHLELRPGSSVIRDLGGLHRFMHWDKPMLTDSGGFQIYSLAKLRKISEEGVTFQSHLDGTSHFLSPEISMEIQKNLGADIVMAFDECPAADIEEEALKVSMDRTTRWLQRSREVRLGAHQGLFAINQGGILPGLRLRHLESILEIDQRHPFEGFAIGGLSVGESKPAMTQVLDAITHQFPEDRPRYLMGVGAPEDILMGIERGIDLFDCVLPSREARHGRLLTSGGRIQIKNSKYRTQENSLDPLCTCYTCLHFSRAYLHHLFRADEFLGLTLNTIHNLSYTVNLARSARKAIMLNRYQSFAAEVRSGWILSENPEENTL